MKKIFFITLLLVISLFSFSQVPSYVSSVNLVAWYSFDGNSADSSGNGNHLTNMGGTTLTTDRFGDTSAAYSFDGVNDHLTITSPSFQMSETGAYTISVWVNYSISPGGWVFAHGLTQGAGGGTGMFCQFMTATAAPDFQWRTNKQGSAWQTLSVTPTAALNTWEHWVAVYNNKNMVLYRNGVQAGTFTYASSGAVAATMPFSLGTNLDRTGSFLNGKLDDIGIWMRALSASEVANLFNPCTTVSGPIDTVSSCVSYTTISGNTYTSTGTYFDTLQTVSGCDSILTLNLTINNVNTSVTTNVDSMTSNAISATYQWLDCDNGFSFISGETNQLFVASATGRYAVAVTENGCTDTSACFTYTNTTGLNEMDKNSMISIFPNPSNGTFTISSDIADNDFQIKIFNIEGKIVKDLKYNNSVLNGIQFSLENQISGLYMIQTTTENDVFINRLVIE